MSVFGWFFPPFLSLCIYKQQKYQKRVQNSKNFIKNFFACENILNYSFRKYFIIQAVSRFSGSSAFPIENRAKV